MGYEQHQQAGKQLAARCAVVTLSDTRTEATDTSGTALRRILAEAGHEVVHYQVIKDEPGDWRALLDALLERADIDAILSNGGTGISRRDQTIGVAERLIEQPLPGFGELFRMLSWEQIGSGAMLSRAVAGIVNGKLLFCMPGSPKAVDLAMRRLIIPELGHLLGELRK
jgi:molybdopterin adenylyltransferase